MVKCLVVELLCFDSVARNLSFDHFCFQREHGSHELKYLDRIEAILFNSELTMLDKLHVKHAIDEGE